MTVDECLTLPNKKVGCVYPNTAAERYIFRNQVATARGSNRTQVPILKHGMRPAFANLKIVMRDTANH